MSEAVHSAYRDELAAYALGSLEPAEASELERHVAGCPQCRDYLFWLDPAIDLLPASVEQLQPPRRLKRALMAEVRDDLSAARRAERNRARADRGLLGFVSRPAIAAAACVLLLAGVVGGYALHGDDEPESVLIEARALDGAAGVPIAATLEREGDDAVLHVEDFPALEGNRVYQAWIERGGRIEPSTPFVVGRDGSTDVVIRGSLEGASGVMVTREPSGGSEIPTLPVIMKAPLA